MSELLIHIGDGSTYRDGDVLCAFTNRRIQIVHQQHICDYRRHWNRFGLRPNNHSRLFLDAAYQYTFTRVHRDYIRRDETTVDGLIVGTEYYGPESIDVRVYLWRRLQHHAHRIFGVPGREVWHGGRFDMSVNMVRRGWEIIETHTPCRRGWCDFRKVNHSLWPFGREELKAFLPVRLNHELTEEVANELVAPLYSDDGETMIKKRANRINWREIGHRELSVLDRQESVGTIRKARSRMVYESSPRLLEAV